MLSACVPCTTVFLLRNSCLLSRFQDRKFWGKTKTFQLDPLEASAMKGVLHETSALKGVLHEVLQHCLRTFALASFKSQ